MARVALDHVSKRYDRAALAVNDVSVDIADREFIVLVGPSGCGKSTTLRLVAGLEEATSGTIHIGERVVNDVAPKDRDIAMVFQNYALYPHMTVYNNMAFGLKMRKFKKDDIRRRVATAAKMLDISHLLDRKPAALSGGERQRVAVGRAIVRNPAAFLFDEPLSNLDAQLRLHMRAELKRLHRELQTTAIYVTHDQEEAIALGDRIVVMKAGVVQQCATPMEVYERPANRFVATFIGTPPMNFFDGTVRSDNGAAVFESPMGKLRLTEVMTRSLEAAGARSLVLGVRPEDLSLGASGGGAGQVPMKVEVISPLGYVKDVRLRTADGKEVIARVPIHTHVAVDASVPVAFPDGRLHAFEPGESGRNLAAAPQMQ